MLKGLSFDKMSYEQLVEALNAPEVVNASGVDVVLLKIKLLRYLTGGYETVGEFIGAIVHNSYTLTNDTSLILEYFLKILVSTNVGNAEDNLLFLSNALLPYKTTFGNGVGGGDSVSSDYLEYVDFQYLSSFDRAKEINTLINRDFILDTFSLDILRIMTLVYRTTSLTKYLK